MRAILTYHSIDDTGSVISIDERTFRRHASWLASGRVRAVGVAELLEMSDDEDGIAITFDDGFENLASVAWPILRDHGLPATVFVVSGHAGGRNDWGGRSEPGIPELPLLDWDALGGLAEEGIEIGSHTRTHPRLAGSAPERLEEEVAGSAEAIRRELGVMPRGFAYPYGSVDDAAAGAASRAYAWACTTELSVIGPEHATERLPRLDSYYFRERGQLEDWGGARFRARLAMRRALRRARARVSEAVTA